MIQGRSSGRQQDIAFGALANDLQKASFHFGAMVAQAALLGVAFEQFRELQKQLQLTNSVAGGTTEQFKAMESSVRNFALASTFSASEAANALYFLASAGFSVEESMSAMTGVLTLAQATLNDINETADLVASSIRAFGLEASEASRIANVMTATITGSQASLNKLAFAFRQVAPVAGALGVTLEQTNGALGQLFNIGLRGEQAGTALRNILIGLTNPAGQAKDLLQELGIQITDSRGKLRDFFKILKDISSKNLVQSDLAKLFGKEAVAGAIALLKSADSGKLDKFTESITGTQRALSVALQQLNTLDGSVKIFNNSVTELGITLGSSLETPARAVLDFISSMVLLFRELAPATRVLTSELVSMGVALFAMNSVFKKLFGLSVLASVVKLGKGMLALGVTVGAVSGSTKAASTAFRGLFSLLRASGPAVLAVAGIATAFGLLVNSINRASEAAADARLNEKLGKVPEVANRLRQEGERTNIITRDTGGSAALNALIDRKNKLTQSLIIFKDVNKEQRKLLVEVKASRENVKSFIDELTSGKEGIDINEVLIKASVKTNDQDSLTNILNKDKNLNPITALISRLELIKKDAGEGSKQARAVTRIVKLLSSGLPETFIKALSDAIRKGSILRTQQLAGALESDERILATKFSTIDKAIAKAVAEQEDVNKQLLETSTKLVTVSPTLIKQISREVVKSTSDPELKKQFEKFFGKDASGIEQLTKIIEDVKREGKAVPNVKKLIKLLTEGSVKAGEGIFPQIAVGLENRSATLIRSNLDILNRALGKIKLRTARTLEGISGSVSNLREAQVLELQALTIRGRATLKRATAKAVDNLTSSTGADPDILDAIVGADFLNIGNEELRVAASKDLGSFVKAIRGRVEEVRKAKIAVIVKTVNDPSDRKKIIDGINSKIKNLGTRLNVDNIFVQNFANIFAAFNENFLAEIAKNDKVIRLRTIKNKQDAIELEKLVKESLPFANEQRLAELFPKDLSLQLRVRLRGIGIKLAEEIRKINNEFTNKINADSSQNTEDNRKLRDQQISLITTAANIEINSASRAMEFAVQDAIIVSDEQTRKLRQKVRSTKEEIDQILATLGDVGGLSTARILEIRTAKINETFENNVESIKENARKLRSELNIDPNGFSQSKGSVNKEQLKDFIKINEQEKIALELEGRLQEAKLKRLNLSRNLATLDRSNNISNQKNLMESLKANGSFLRGVAEQSKLFSLTVTTAFEDGADAAKLLSKGLRDSFSDALFDTEFNLKESLARMLNQFARFAFDVATKGVFEKASEGILNKILGTAGLTTKSSNKTKIGSAFSGSSFLGSGISPTGSDPVTPFARGGIINGPTILAGEAGREGILPLTRTSNGDLGVKAVGSGGSSRLSFNTSIKVSVAAPNAPQQAGNPGAGAEELGKQISGLVNAAFNKNLANEMRPGGVLSGFSR